ncbi:hypothetical protein ACIA5G_50950 [Amycolatopsis sp. NPDC051758]|uniref:hypothetical protein n=1 Tax=Amycolatopsis sp. NPDC051758 TaxID=3363935 RepID=UPI0037AB18BF
MVMTAQHEGEPTTYLLQLGNGGTADARWMLGTTEPGIGFFGEYTYRCPHTPPGGEPTEAVADWVADALGVSNVELEIAANERAWSVTIVV